MPASISAATASAAAVSKKEPRKKDATPAIVSTATFLVTALTLAWAKPDQSQWFIVGLSAIGIGLLTYILQWRGRSSTVGGVCVGLAAGVWQVIDIIKYIEEGAFLLTFATLAVFVSLGLIFGAFIEFTFYMHGLFHRLRVMQ